MKVGGYICIRITETKASTLVVLCLDTTDAQVGILRLPYSRPRVRALLNILVPEIRAIGGTEGSLRPAPRWLERTTWVRRRCVGWVVSV